MVRFFLITLIGISSIFCQSQELPDSIVKHLKAGVLGFKERYHSPSVVVCVVHGSEIIFSDAVGYTDVENTIPATIHSKYPILSVTKTFTATMYMQLVERKILNLVEDVSKYLPEYTAGSDPARKITFFQLATHSAGLPRNSPADISFTKQIDMWLLARSKYRTIEPANKIQFLKSLKHLEKNIPIINC